MPRTPKKKPLPRAPLKPFNVGKKKINPQLVLHVKRGGKGVFFKERRADPNDKLQGRRKPPNFKPRLLLERRATRERKGSNVKILRLGGTIATTRRGTPLQPVKGVWLTMEEFLHLREAIENAANKKAKKTPKAKKKATIKSTKRTKKK